MGLREEMVEDKYEEVEGEEEFPQHVKKVVVVGYALTSKKIKSFLKPKLVGLARNKGILFVAIDQRHIANPLLSANWRQLTDSCFFRDLDYQQIHPEVTVLDPPDAIQHVYNRQSMLQDVSDLNLSDAFDYYAGKVGVPRQLVIKKDPSSIPDAVNKAGLMLPLVAKPLVVDGSAKSHQLSLAYDQYSLQMLEPPLVLQEFINHGGILFKVYIVGEAIKVVRRFSLPDVSERELSKNAGVFQFPRVSCAAASADDVDLDPSVAGEEILFKRTTSPPILDLAFYLLPTFLIDSGPVLKQEELPPRPLLERLAQELRHRLGLHLFNLDIIREHGTQDRFYVIDINYFPGYGKIPEYELIFADFLLSLVQSKHKKR